MFESHLINERKTTSLRLSLGFNNEEINFYTCSVKLIEESLNEVYDFSADVLHLLPPRAGFGGRERYTFSLLRGMLFAI